MVQMPDGRLINAGIIASYYDHGWSQQSVDALVQGEIGRPDDADIKEETHGFRSINDRPDSSGFHNATPNSSQSTGDTSQVTKNMFLQLLVAQIKNQDPLNPSDGVQFLTQLAQFQQLEQSMNMGQDLSAIRSDLDQLVQTGSTTGTTPTS